MNTQQLLVLARENDACTPALKYLKANTHRPLQDLLEECIEKNPDWILWGIGKIPEFEVDEETLKLCTRKKPCAALQFASSLLDKEILKFCIGKKPGEALRSVSNLLDEETLKLCAGKEPWVALKYASNLLDKETLKLCAKKAPQTALEYASNFLDKETLNWCKEQR